MKRVISDPLNDRLQGDLHDLQEAPPGGAVSDVHIRRDAPYLLRASDAASADYARCDALGAYRPQNSRKAVLP